MGGDIGPAAVVPASLQALSWFPDLHLVLVGDQSAIQAQLEQARATAGDRLTVLHASQKVEMDELPSQALRGKKDSSMRVAINQVKDGNAHACVSAGNTGALMAIARFVLKMLPGVDRPAIITALPAVRGHTHVLDLGANAACSAEHLYQFAIMGSVLAQAVDGVSSPAIGLLNIGEEEIKGNETVKEAAAMLATSGLNYVGFVEGNDIYTGGCDVVVCDGFTGNVLLKTSEGLATLISKFIRDAFTSNIYSKVAALVAMPVIRVFRRKIDPRKYNGASLLGLRGIVIKSHGGADAVAFANAIRIAVAEVKNAVPQRISDQLDQYLAKRAVH